MDHTIRQKRSWTLAIQMLATCLAVALGVVVGCGGGSSGTTVVQGEGGACTAGQVLCGGACSDPKTDRANCGACGTACKDGQVC
jgi:hypothetical protein